MAIPADTYFIVTPGSNVVNMPGAYAKLGATDLFFYITETGSLRVVNMNSSGGGAAPGLISYALAQNAKWVSVITQPGNAVLHVYYTDANGQAWYSPYSLLGSTVKFKQMGGITVSALNLSAIFTATSTPPAYLLMVDDGLKHNLFVASDPAFNNQLANPLVTYNNAINTTVYISRPSIAMHPSDTNTITVTCQQTVIQTSATSVGFYEIKVPGVV